jgi:hypothetical protein
MNGAGSGRLGKVLAALNRMIITAETARLLNILTGNSEGSLEIVSTFFEKGHTTVRDRENARFLSRQALVMSTSEMVVCVLKGHDFSRSV